MENKIKVLRKSDESQSSAQIVASIDDLLIAILLFLPIKSLICFKQVCKHWHSLITNQTFCHSRNPNPDPATGLFLHRLRYRARPWIEYFPFCGTQSRKPPLRKLKFVKDPSGIRIVHSCNGLLLCSSFKARDSNRRYYVHNPTTNKFLVLPKIDIGSGKSSRIISGMSLAFDPNKSPHYEVVCVQKVEWDMHNMMACRYQIEVYSSEMGSWRKCGRAFTAQVNFENGVYFRGAIHWVSIGNGIGDSIYFNTDDNNIKVMPAPPIGWDCRNNYYFGESCGHLHYIKVSGPGVEFDVYEMKMDYSDWFVKYRIDLSPLVTAYPGMIRKDTRPTSSYYYAFSIFSLVRGEREEDSFLVLQIPGKAIRYNIVCETFEMLCEFAGINYEGALGYLGTEGFQYIESLCSV